MMGDCIHVIYMLTSRLRTFAHAILTLELSNSALFT